MSTQALSVPAGDETKSLLAYARDLWAGSHDATIDALIDTAESDIQKLQAAYDFGAALMLPTKQAEPKLQGKRCEKLSQAISAIGMKIRPEMENEQCDDWTLAMVGAISDLPYHSALEAARETIHSPIEFLSQVHAKIIALEGPIRARKKLAIDRIALAMEKIRNPKPELPPPPPSEPLSDEEIARMKPELQQLGLAAGFFDQQRLDSAMEAFPPHDEEGQNPESETETRE
jgi:hypothetical protein